MIGPSSTPPAEVSVDDGLILALLRDQHPDLAALGLGARHEGWDNVTARLGPDLAVRMPRRQLGADLLPTELDWLGRICANVPFRAPVPVRIGVPGRGYPWMWSVVPWIEGITAYRVPLSETGVRELGRALAALHRPAPPDAPVNPFRSGSLLKRADVMEERLHSLERIGPSRGWRLDAKATRFAYYAGARRSRPRRTWCHLDLHGGNVLTIKGSLAGIIDWGDAGAGDPATDLGQAMVLVGAGHVDALIDAYGSVDAPMFVRACAEAVSYGLALATFEGDAHASAGWRALADLGLATPIGR